MWDLPNKTTVIAFAIAAAVSIYFRFSDVGLILAFGVAFCVSLVTDRDVDRSWAIGLLVIASLSLFWTFYYASRLDVPILDVLAMRSDNTTILRTMAGTYICLIGAAFIEIAHRL